MNKRYRVIFNETTQTYTAVAEDAPAKGKKTSTTTKALVATAIGLGATTITYASWVSAVNGGASAPGALPIGGGTAALQTAQTSGNDGIALGTGNATTDLASAGRESIAIGKGANAAYGNSIGNSIAIGHYSDAGANSLAIGNNATATDPGSFAVGNNASASGNSIAVGHNSQASNLTTAEQSGIGVSLNDTYYAFAAANKTSSFSVGSKGAERVITNVGAGQVTANSTQAVNGSQLYAAYSTINDVSNQTWNLQVSSKNTPLPPTAIGTKNTVNFAEGQNIELSHNALGDTHTITVATARNVDFDNVTVGPVVINRNTGINAGHTKIINVNKGAITKTSTDAINGSQLYTVVDEITNNTWNLQVSSKNNPLSPTAVGNKNTVNFAEGKNIELSHSALGDTHTITIATARNVDFDNVTVGPVVINRNTGINAGNTKIINVKDGSITQNSKDAINGGQIYNLLDGVGSWTLISEDTKGSTVQTKINSTTPLTINGNGSNTKVQMGKNASGDPALTVSAAAPVQYVDANGNPTADQFTATNTVAIIGKNGAKDPVKVTNVNKGAVTKTSTDAINGSQLYALGSSIGDIIGGGMDFVDGDLVWNVNKGGNTYNKGIGDTGYDNIHDAIKHITNTGTVANGWTYSIDNAASGQVKDNGNFDFLSKSTTVNGETFSNITIENNPNGAGIQLGLAKDIGVESITVGETKISNKDGNLQIGQGTITSGRKDSIGLGEGYTINADNSLALGNGSVADTPVGTAGVTIRGDKYTFAGTNPVGTVSVGSKDAERTITHVAAGRINASSTDAINGSQLYATNQAVEKLNNGGAGVVQYADPATPTTPNGGKPTNTATLVGKDGDKPVTLTNLAPGKAPTDAVNVSQLKQGLDEANKHSNAGTAAAMATGLLPQAYDAGSSMVGVSAADFDGEQGYAIGYSSVSEGGKWIVRAAGSGNSQEKFGVGASVGYRWG